MHSIPDLEAAARRRLPRRVYDFIAGGAGTEAGVKNNLAAFERVALVPRTLVNIQPRTTATRLLGRDYKAPFGIAPMGMCNIAWPGTDHALAGAARRAGLPYCLSMAGSSALADVHDTARDHLWYQIYLCGDDALLERQCAVAERLGVENLILTVDVPLPGRRLRDVRNDFSVPIRWTPSLLLDFAMHPTWSLQTLWRSAPRMRNMESFVTDGDGPSSLAAILAMFASAVYDWEALARLRARWKRKLIVKGILNAIDAARLARMGADAIVVSNHGSRQLGSVVSSLDALPLIRAAVGADFPLILDSGIRSGENIAVALALGADFVLAGRPFLFGSAALGPARGVDTAISILRAELDSTLAQLGCTGPAMLTPDFIHARAKA